MASSPITSWQIDGKTTKTVRDFLFLGSKISVDGDCCHEIKRCLLLGRKAMTNLDSTLKCRDIHYFADKGPYSQSHGFSSIHVWMWELDHKEGWILKNTFELWCWRRLLKVPWTARRSHQSILNIHWKDWCWSWSSNTLATWCEEPTHWERPWCWERLKAKGDGGQQRMRCLDGIVNSMDMNSSKEIM